MKIKQWIRKIQWQKIVKILRDFVISAVRKYLIPAVLSAVKVSGGFWTRVATWIALKFVNSSMDKAESAARLKDQENIDNQLLEKYKEQKNDPNATEQDLIQTETDILNGGRRRS